jgi:hypothetical protein
LIASSGRLEQRHREIVGFCAGLALLAVVLVLGLAFKAPLANMMQHVFVLGAT